MPTIEQISQLTGMQVDHVAESFRIPSEQDGGVAAYADYLKFLHEQYRDNEAAGLYIDLCDHETTIGGLLLALIGQGNIKDELKNPHKINSLRSQLSAQIKIRYPNLDGETVNSLLTG